MRRPATSCVNAAPSASWARSSTTSCTSGGDGAADLTSSLAQLLLTPHLVDFSAVVSVVLSAVLVAGVASRPGAEESCIVLDDFARAKPGEFPADWKPRKDEG